MSRSSRLPYTLMLRCHVFHGWRRGQSEIFRLLQSFPLDPCGVPGSLRSSRISGEPPETSGCSRADFQVLIYGRCRPTRAHTCRQCARGAPRPPIKDSNPKRAGLGPHRQAEPELVAPTHQQMEPPNQSAGVLQGKAAHARCQSPVQ